MSRASDCWLSFNRPPADLTLPLDAPQRWALALKVRSNHNEATCALANQIARIAWATGRRGTVFDPDQSASMAA